MLNARRHRTRDRERGGEGEGGKATVLNARRHRTRDRRRLRVLQPNHRAVLNARRHRTRDRVCFALATGADSSDIERATAADYDPERRVIHIHGRKNTSRDQEIPIHPHAQELFEYALARLPVSWPRASKALGEACKRAGIGHLSPKDLRRTAGSWLVASGVHISLVSRFLRHGSDAMVRQVYGQLSPEELRDLLDGQSGTNSLQLPSSAYALEQEPAEKQPRPLGGIGRHEGFKSRRALRQEKQNGEEPPSSSGLNGPETTASDAVEHTETLQSSDPEEAAFAAAVVEHSERGRVAELLARPLAKMSIRERRELTRKGVSHA